MQSTRHTFIWQNAMDAGVLRRPLLLALYARDARGANGQVVDASIAGQSSSDGAHSPAVGESSFL